MIYLIAALVLAFGSSAWVKWQLNRFNQKDSMSGNGRELAEHLIRRFQLSEVKVEVGQLPDHYDPVRKCIVLNEAWAERSTLTSATIAAHEFGHAMQDHLGDTTFKRHCSVMKWTYWIRHLSQVAAIGLLGFAWIPFVAKGLMFALLAAALVNLALQLLILPIEWDASFGKALPILAQGEYFNPQELKGARKVLTAAALTYIANAVVDIFNFRLLLNWLRR